MNDKVLHFIAGFLLSLIGILFIPFILLGFLFAFGKEWYDGYTGTGVVDINDIIATILGSITSSSFILYLIFYLD